VIAVVAVRVNPDVLVPIAPVRVLSAPPPPPPQAASPNPATAASPSGATFLIATPPTRPRLTESGVRDTIPFG
jgi:hypothetical protein